MKTNLSKVLTVSSKFQITIPQNVREILRIQQNDEVLFTTDGKQVFFEKVKHASMYGQLIAFARHVLQQGHHLYITGGIASGKSFLAHEIASYEFNRISYFGDHQTFEGPEEKVLKKMDDTINTHTTTKDVTILDEYHRLQQMGVTVELFGQCSGALMAVSPRLEFLPLPKKKKVYHIHILNKMEHFDFELKLYEPFKERHMTMDINLQSDTPNAISMYQVIQHVKDSIVESKMERFFEGQLLAVVDETIRHMKKNDLYKVTDLLQMVSTIRQQNSELNVDLLTSFYQYSENYLRSIGIK